MSFNESVQSRFGLQEGPRQCSLRLGTDGTFRVTGYTPDEVGEILAAFRNHQTLMSDLTQRQAVSPDAVRYRPEGT